MKRLFLASILILLLTIGSAWATTFTLTQDQLLHFYETYENPANAATELDTTPQGITNNGSGGVTFQGDLYDSDNPGGGFAQIQVGLKDEFDGTSWYATDFDGNTTYGAYSPYNGTTLKSIHDYGIYDLSGYTEYSLILTNTNDDNWLVNLFMNTGWIPSNTNYYYQNTWTQIAPGQSVTLTLDFSSAETWGGGYNGGTSAVQNLNQVTNIGFNIGGNMDQIGGNPSNPDKFSIDAAPIPEPSTVILLGLGFLGLCAYGWRKKKQS